MISCRQARRIIIDCVRRQSGEADRLLLEDHLSSCRGCREERGRWALLERLRNATPAPLTVEARARVLGHLVSGPVAAHALARRSWPVRPFLLGGAVAAIAALAVMGGKPWSKAADPSARDPSSRETSATPAPAETLLNAERAGETSLPGVRIAYAAGTVLRVRSPEREVHLLGGEIDVDVTPHGQGEFRVFTSRFVVEVLGTRFVVGPDSVRTLRGRVRVLAPTGETLAVLGAGESWMLAPENHRADSQASLPAAVPAEAPSSAPAPHLGPKHAPARAAVRPASLQMATDASDAASARTSTRTSARLLGEAREFLVTGDTTRARERIAAALAAKPSFRERARAALLTADAFLVERERGQALAAYQRTATLFASTPEGESAAFMSAELLSEQRLRPEARAAFESYLARHPNGRFAREARDKLSTLSP